MKQIKQIDKTIAEKASNILLYGLCISSVIWGIRKFLQIVPDTPTTQSTTLITASLFVGVALITWFYYSVRLGKN
ncbi:hypothetical protein ACFQ48_12815 [Hymenobacter caeli]|uniref:DUF202 domain-containing protein n=1 Tax=Hymenobacter caeli TaxID=2735894 RepID=A0ABX2FTX3_9BACT|nr:hypothetical protein [Hymenobacter caeli]NRT20283.1 hypothetical protein [Hymenobacter caeli]